MKRTRFFITTSHAKIEYGELKMEMLCPCGRTDCLSLSAADLVNGQKFNCPSCKRQLELNPMSWVQKVVAL